MRRSSSSPSGIARLSGLAAVLGTSQACVEHPVDGAEYEWVVQSTWHTIAQVENDDVDILLVLDDSRSMAEEQATLSANLATFARLLDGAGIGRNYRLGITTTDDGNPLCSPSTADAGALQLRSCRSHLEDFALGGATPLDVTEEACTARCPEAWAEIEPRPTTTAHDDVPRPRTWIERIAGESNLPAGLTTEQALQCLAPQGIAGCEYESPLESMWKAVHRSTTVHDPDFGFIRDLAVLLVLVVTDEDDCSYDPRWESIFLPEGERVFWADADAPAATSAVCWNAGVACTGAGTYDECHAVDLDVRGEAVAEDEAEGLAVLHPVSRYVDLLQELEDRKRVLWPSQEVLVSIVGGVGPDGGATYEDAVDDPEFQRDFGIGPGCESESGRGIPPVRLRELAEAFQLHEEPAMVSICGDDYSTALEPLARTLLGQIRPACMPVCVADVDRSTPDVLDPSCALVQSAPAVAGAPVDVAVPPCEAGGVLPDGHDVCHVPIVGEERSEYCIDLGTNLEFRLVRREGVYVLPGTVVRASCEASTSEAIDCPGLP